MTHTHTHTHTCIYVHIHRRKEQDNIILLSIFYIYILPLQHIDGGNNKIKRSPRQKIYDKDNKVKTTHFEFVITGEGGKKHGSTYIDHKNETVKDAWIIRHKVNGAFDDYMNASSLARYILWNKKSLRESIAEYKRRLE